MTRNLTLVLSAFTSLIAVVTLVDGALLPASSGVSRTWMVGVLVVGTLCWLRWRWGWRHTLLVPSLLVGALMLLSFAAMGIGDLVQVSAAGNQDARPSGIMNVLLAVQGGLILVLMWSDRRAGGGRTSSEANAGDRPAGPQGTDGSEELKP